METVKKIVVIGPESTGKSTLCEKLAAHYHTLWVQEYAREYLEKKGPDYIYEDLLSIAKGQIDLEEKLTAKSYQLSGIGINSISRSQESPASSPPSGAGGLLFIDTNLLVMQVWSEFVYNQCDNWILNRIVERKYDLYLLCDVDLPWVEDALRECPDKKIREKIFLFYKDLMVNQSTPWYIISGNYEERLDKAIQCIETSFT